MRLQGTLPFQCSVGGRGKGLAHKHLLDGHMVCHTGTKEEECANCGKKYAYKHNLARHEKKCKGISRSISQDDSAGSVKYEIEGCTLTFSDIRGLKRHQAAKPEDFVQKFVCEKCKKRFSYSSGFARHRKLLMKCNMNETLADALMFDFQLANRKLLILILNRLDLHILDFKMDTISVDEERTRNRQKLDVF
eukprot:Seg5736.1 transcript_id=Seg5736.1/GoldUCD/mRNA.D3Y31 product="Zinc finger protein 345" protein_id=Seg5736.1/GoldUCD/D3Y31